MKYRVTIFIWCICFSVLAWITIVKSVWEGRFWWPFRSPQEAKVVSGFTALAIVSAFSLIWDD